MKYIILERELLDNLSDGSLRIYSYLFLDAIREHRGEFSNLTIRGLRKLTGYGLNKVVRSLRELQSYNIINAIRPSQKRNGNIYKFGAPVCWEFKKR